MAHISAAPMRFVDCRLPLPQLGQPGIAALSLSPLDVSTLRISESSATCWRDMAKHRYPCRGRRRMRGTPSLRNVPVVRAEQAGRAGLWRRGFLSALGKGSADRWVLRDECCMKDYSLRVGEQSSTNLQGLMVHRFPLRPAVKARREERARSPGRKTGAFL
jgi:hypothetical protein